MRDLSINLPSWAYHLGYRLEGGVGTYDELFLYKDFRVVRKWEWLERQPSIFEMEEIVGEVEREFNHTTTRL